MSYLTLFCCSLLQKTSHYMQDCFTAKKLKKCTYCMLCTSLK